MLTKAVTGSLMVCLFVSLCYITVGQTNKLPPCKNGRDCRVTCPWDSSNNVPCPHGYKLQYEYEKCGTFDRFGSVYVSCRNGSLYCRDRCNFSCQIKVPLNTGGEV